MSGFVGKTKQLDNVSSDIAPLRSGLTGYLMGQGYDTLFSQGSDEELLAPYRALFEQQNKVGLAQAKESAGNLTGSGYAASLGSYLNRAVPEQNAFLAMLLEQRRRQDADRYANLAGGLATSGVGAPTQAYQPGFLDYLFEGANVVASAVPFSGNTGTRGGGARGAPPVDSGTGPYPGPY